MTPKIMTRVKLLSALSVGAVLQGSSCLPNNFWADLSGSVIDNAINTAIGGAIGSTIDVWISGWLGGFIGCVIGGVCP